MSRPNALNWLTNRSIEKTLKVEIAQRQDLGLVEAEPDRRRLPRQLLCRHRMSAAGLLEKRLSRPDTYYGEPAPISAPVPVHLAHR